MPNFQSDVFFPSHIVTYFPTMALSRPEEEEEEVVNLLEDLDI